MFENWFGFIECVFCAEILTNANDAQQNKKN